jgi:hypothetical protein
MKLHLRSVCVFGLGLLAGPVLVAVLLAGCTAPLNDEAIEEYHRASAAGSAAVSSEAAERGLENWKTLLSNLTVENIHGKTSQVYAERTFFNDTLKTLRTSAEIEAYLLETAKMLESGTVEYRDTVRSEDGSYYVRWEMVYRGKKLAGGQPIRTIGMSQLRFDERGRVILHQDFWDASRGIFEHIPVIGPQVRWVKGKL